MLCSDGVACQGFAGLCRVEPESSDESRGVMYYDITSSLRLPRRGSTQMRRQRERAERIIQAKPATVREEGEPSRGTPWWPPQPLALLLKLVIIYVIGVIQASLAASCFLFRGIPFDCTEHSFQYRV